MKYNPLVDELARDWVKENYPNYIIHYKTVKLPTVELVIRPNNAWGHGNTKVVSLLYKNDELVYVIETHGLWTREDDAKIENWYY